MTRINDSSGPSPKKILPNSSRDQGDRTKPAKDAGQSKEICKPGSKDARPAYLSGSKPTPSGTQKEGGACSTDKGDGKQSDHKRPERSVPAPVTPGERGSSTGSTKPGSRQNAPGKGGLPADDGKTNEGNTGADGETDGEDDKAQAG